MASVPVRIGIKATNALAKADEKLKSKISKEDFITWLNSDEFWELITIVMYNDKGEVMNEGTPKRSVRPEFIVEGEIKK